MVVMVVMGRVVIRGASRVAIEIDAGPVTPVDDGQVDWSGVG
jgi:hypothetical protein